MEWSNGVDEETQERKQLTSENYQHVCVCGYLLLLRMFVQWLFDLTRYAILQKGIKKVIVWYKTHSFSSTAFWHFSFGRDVSTSVLFPGSLYPIFTH
jgi:hypothetical protein